MKLDERLKTKEIKKRLGRGIGSGKGKTSGRCKRTKITRCRNKKF